MSGLASRVTINSALLIDVVGCFVGAAMLILFPSIWDVMDLPHGWRQPVAVALFLFSVILVTAARYRSKPLIAFAVLGNIGWVILGAAALFATGTWLGGIIIAIVMVADTILARLQSRGLIDDTLAA